VKAQKTCHYYYHDHHTVGAPHPDRASAMCGRDDW
jgi:hypothetical protein